MYGVTMSFLEDLSRQRRNPAAVLHQYLVLEKSPDGTVVLFVEGKDDQSFYLPLVRRYSNGRDLHCFVCDGKRGVLEVFERVRKKPSWPNTVVLYFVDKDIDDLVDRGSNAREPDVYCTRWYSIENYLVGESVLEIVWSELFKLPSDHPRKTEAIELYRTQYDRFVRAVRTVMAWGISRRRQCKRVYWNNLPLDQCYSLDQSLVFSKLPGASAKIRRRCGEVSPQEWRNVKTTCAELVELPPKAYIRGKFELWFFIKFLVRLGAMLRDEGNTELRPRSGLTIGTGNAVEVLAPRVQVPEELDRFLSTRLA